MEEYTEKLHKKDLHDPDNHDGVITHLEPDILEGKVKWLLGSITKCLNLLLLESKMGFDLTQMLASIVILNKTLAFSKS